MYVSWRSDKGNRYIEDELIYRRGEGMGEGSRDYGGKERWLVRISGRKGNIGCFGVDEVVLIRRKEMKV